MNVLLKILLLFVAVFSGGCSTMNDVLDTTAKITLPSGIVQKYGEQDAARRFAYLGESARCQNIGSPFHFQCLKMADVCMAKESGVDSMQSRTIPIDSCRACRMEFGGYEEMLTVNKYSAKLLQAVNKGQFAPPQTFHERRGPPIEKRIYCPSVFSSTIGNLMGDFSTVPDKALARKLLHQLREVDPYSIKSIETRRVYGYRLHDPEIVAQTVLDKYDQDVDSPEQTKDLRSQGLPLKTYLDSYLEDITRSEYLTCEQKQSTFRLIVEGQKRLNLQGIARDKINAYANYSCGTAAPIEAAPAKPQKKSIFD